MTTYQIEKCGKIWTASRPVVLVTRGADTRRSVLMQHQRNTLPATCAHCARVFQTSADQVRRGRGKYCSRVCRYAPKTSTFTVCADGVSAAVPLQDRHGNVKGYAVIDLTDAEWVCQRRWNVSGDGYARRSEYPDGRHVCIKLHREILGLTEGDGMEGDHKDRDRLNNRRSNLRIVTKAGNLQNTSSTPGSSSAYRGVFWDKAARKWVAQVKHMGKSRRLGQFDSETDAAEAARNARAELMEYARD